MADVTTATTGIWEAEGRDGWMDGWMPTVLSRGFFWLKLGYR